MKTTKYVLATLIVSLGVSCAHIHKEIPVTLLEPDVQSLTVTVRGATIQNPDGPFLWKWGDGTIEENYFPNSDTYAKPGFYHVEVQVSRKGHSKTADLYLRLVDTNKE
ncbi:MAG: hypothetical protein R6V12_05530 [Candidatus Hydrogenedentota bacterium]